MLHIGLHAWRKAKLEFLHSGHVQSLSLNEERWSRLSLTVATVACDDPDGNRFYGRCHRSGLWSPESHGRNFSRSCRGFLARMVTWRAQEVVKFELTVNVADVGHWLTG